MLKGWAAGAAGGAAGKAAWGAALGAGLLALALSGCERGASSPSRAHDAASSSASGASDSGRSYDGGGAARDGDRDGGRGYASRGGDDDAPRRAREPVPTFKGEPMWADNRKHTAEENAKYHCDKSGSDIGASSLDECLTKVHAFLDHPPAGAETVTRGNGDKLVYDPKANLFAVARKDGAPRTFFKPREGADYWRQQQAEAKSGEGYRRRYGAGTRGDSDQG